MLSKPCRLRSFAYIFGFTRDRNPEYVKSWPTTVHNTSSFVGERTDSYLTNEKTPALSIVNGFRVHKENWRQRASKISPDGPSNDRPTRADKPSLLWVVSKLGEDLGRNDLERPRTTLLSADILPSDIEACSFMAIRI